MMMMMMMMMMMGILVPGGDFGFRVFRSEVEGWRGFQVGNAVAVMEYCVGSEEFGQRRRVWSAGGSAGGSVAEGLFGGWRFGRRAEEGGREGKEKKIAGGGRRKGREGKEDCGRRKEEGKGRKARACCCSMNRLPVRAVARGGRTVVTTIHQPSSRLYTMFGRIGSRGRGRRREGEEDCCC
ncbi:ABC transporter G family member 21 [Linum perenne]